MSVRTLTTSIRAWITGLFTKEPVMADETVADTTATEATATTPVVEVSTTTVNTDTLKSILAALGHDLEAVWDDAIALAKKAL